MDLHKPCRHASKWSAKFVRITKEIGNTNPKQLIIEFTYTFFRGEQSAVKTEVAEPSQNPLWNTTVEIKNVSGEQLMDKTIEVSLWDARPDKDQVFLGKQTSLIGNLNTY